MKKGVWTDGKATAKNILLAVITSVLGATVIYFLGFNNKKKLTAAEKEEATIETWKSYNSIENIHTQNLTSLMQDAMQYQRFGDIKIEAGQNSERLISSIDEFIETDGVDEKLVQLLKDRVKAEKKISVLSAGFYENIDKVVSGMKTKQLPKQQVEDTAYARARQYIGQIKGILAPTAETIEKLAADFSKKYDQPFDLNEFLFLKGGRYGKNIFDLSLEKTVNTVTEEKKEDKKPVVSNEVLKLGLEYFTGNWKSGNIRISFYKNGELTWNDKSNNRNYDGEWTFNNGQLALKMKGHPLMQADGILLLVPDKIKPDSFTMQTADNKEIFNMEKI